MTISKENEIKELKLKLELKLKDKLTQISESKNLNSCTQLQENENLIMQLANQKLLFQLNINNTCNESNKENNSEIEQGFVDEYIFQQQVR